MDIGKLKNHRAIAYGRWDASVKAREDAVKVAERYRVQFELLDERYQKAIKADADRIQEEK